MDILRTIFIGWFILAIMVAFVWALWPKAERPLHVPMNDERRRLLYEAEEPQ